MLDATIVQSTIGEIWRQSAIPALVDYIRIPNLSPAYDAEWVRHGHMAKATALIETWCRERAIPGANVEVCELPGRTPLILIEIPARDAPGEPGSASADDTVLLYGHLDKQPEMVGWREGFGPWTPVIEGDRLFGRGGGDDGYAVFAALSAIEALYAAGGAHRRVVVLIEASEESGSPDLPAHIDALSERLGSVSLVIGLDSACLTYDRLWITTSLRGLVGGVFRVEVLDEGVHSGSAGGVIPSSFRIMRTLLDRIEDSATGNVRVAELHVEVPAERREGADAVAAEFGHVLAGEFPLVRGMSPTGSDQAALELARTWQPSIAYTGVDGFPPTASAGNVLRPFTALRLAVRIPPTCDPNRAQYALQHALVSEPPYGARVSFEPDHVAAGWNAPTTAPWLSRALEDASVRHFGKPPSTLGEGGTIPFMAMLGERFPSAQFVVTGVLGPGSNAHGPNEYLDLPTAQRLSACITDVLDRHARAS